jgi:hypothetical protein
MPCGLSKLTAGSYDIIFNGVIIASLVRADTRHHDQWIAELLVPSGS